MMLKKIPVKLSLHVYKGAKIAQNLKLKSDSTLKTT